MYFDTHAHVNFNSFNDDKNAAIERALKSKVWLANVGTSLATSKSAVDLANQYDKGVYATIGLHPVHTWQDVKDEAEMQDMHIEEFDASEYGKLITDKVVAVGEIGLDYFRIPDGNTNAKQLQKKNFSMQLAFAKDKNLPVVIHCRDAYMDLLDILDAEYEGGGIIHSFTDTYETAKKFLDRGYFIAFNAILTFDKSGKLSEVCKKMPSDRILTETDSPYLAPAPFRGKRNEPSHVRLIAEHISHLRREDLAKVAEYTTDNALTVYRIK